MTGGSTNNIAASPLITVSSGAVLDLSGLSGGALVLGAGSVNQTITGSGTIAGNLTINGGSTIAATMTAKPTITGAGGLTMNNNSIASFDLTGLAAGTGSASSLVTLANGNLTINGTGLVNLTGTVAAAGNYELFAFPHATAAPTSGLSTTGTPPAGYLYSFIYTPTEIDLMVAIAAGSAQWNAGSGNYTVLSNWNPARVPNGATYTATFGDGSMVPAGAVAVSVNEAEVVGGLAFTTAASSYTLATDGAGGHGLTLNNGASASTISVTAGSHAISANMTIAGSGGLAITTAADLSPSLPSLTISGTLAGSGGVSKAGAGTLVLGNPTNQNTYTGGTTISAGALRTTADSALGSGGLSIGAAAVNLGGSENLTSLSMTDPAGTLRVAEAKTLTITQTSTNATAAGLITLTGASGSGAGASLTWGGTKTLEINAAPALGKNSSLSVNGGTLRLNVMSGTPSVAAGVTAMVASGATLELTGTVSALADPSALSSQPAPHPLQRVAVLNDGTLRIDGTNGVQQVGGIDPYQGTSGNVVVADTASLTADRINQASLVIGSGSTFTLAPSDANGNPMVSSFSPGPMARGSAAIDSPASLILAGSLTPSSSFLASSASLLGASSARLDSGGFARQRRERCERECRAGAVDHRVVVTRRFGCTAAVEPATTNLKAAAKTVVNLWRAPGPKIYDRRRQAESSGTAMFPSAAGRSIANRVADRSAQRCRLSA